MEGGGRRKECGPGYLDRLVFQEKPWTGVWGWQPLDYLKWATQDDTPSPQCWVLPGSHRARIEMTTLGHLCCHPESPTSTWGSKGQASESKRLSPRVPGHLCPGNTNGFSQLASSQAPA